MNANKLVNFIKDNESLLLNLHVKYNRLMADDIILAKLQNVKDQTLNLGNISSCIPGIYQKSKPLHCRTIWQSVLCIY